VAVHEAPPGPAVTFTGLIPDLHHYKGSFGGRAFPLWRDRNASIPNTPPNLLGYLGQRYQQLVSAEDLIAYIAAVAAHPAFIERFKSDLVQPGLRMPLTADGEIFAAATELGRTVIWLHTFGERFADPSRGRPAGPPRMAPSDAPRIPADGAIPPAPAAMPDTIDYDEANRRLLVGHGYVEGVDARVWNYEISGKQVLRQWFSYRKANRERPMIGDWRPPFRARRTSARSLARRVHNGAHKRSQRARTASRSRTVSSRSTRTDLFSPDHHCRQAARGRCSHCRR